MENVLVASIFGYAYLSKDYTILDLIGLTLKKTGRIEEVTGHIFMVTCGTSKSFY